MDASDNRFYREKDPLNGWRPIDTAPEGTFVLCFCRLDNRVWYGVAAREPGFDRPWTAGCRDGFLMRDYENTPTSFATHWMPLPDSPNK